NGVDVEPVGRSGHGRPNGLDVIEEGKVSLVINTVSRFDGSPNGKAASDGGVLRDGYRIRDAAEKNRITRCTSLDPAAALVAAIARHRTGQDITVPTVSEY